MFGLNFLRECRTVTLGASLVTFPEMMFLCRLSANKQPVPYDYPKESVENVGSGTVI